jgi:membrane peptidoglycan carboxypeptidase
VRVLLNDRVQLRTRALRCLAYPEAVTWMRRRDRSLLSNATSLLICGLLAGVVVAAAAFPAMAMGGLAAKAGADTFDSLPTVLTVQQSPQVTRVYASDQKTLISTFYDENRRDISIEEVAPVMQHAMVAAEDTRFYKHRGVDVKGVARAFVANQNSGETAQGASTLTMQYVRQALEYFTSTPQDIVNATTDSPGRKIQEMRYALALEKQLNKTQILERYLNIAPFGNNAFGIYAASQVYFGVAPKDLTLGEAALLSGLVKAPSSFDPKTPQGLKDALDRRNNYVLPNMVKMGYISEADRQKAIDTPLNFKAGYTEPNGCTQVSTNNWGFFCDYFYRWWISQPAFGADEYERRNRLKSGGFTIVTSLDVNAQASAMKNITHGLAIGKSDALMLAGVEPKTGRIQLMAVNRVYSNDQSANGPNTNPDKKGKKGNYPNTTTPLISGGGDIYGYQFGSTFKMFTMITALEQGIPLSYTFNATNPYVGKEFPVQAGSDAACPGTTYYCPKNASDSEVGPYNMWSGFGASVNTWFVPLESQVGAENVVKTSAALGIQLRAPEDAKLAQSAHTWGAFTLGVVATTPLDMANAYATVAGDGIYCEPLPVISITDHAGNKLAAANPRCHQAIPADVAHAAADAARCPVGDHSATTECGGHATSGVTRGIVGKPVAGKTGTTDHDKTAALIVMTPRVAVAGIIADPDDPLLVGYPNKRFSHDQVNYAVNYTVRDFMRDRPGDNFPAPSTLLVRGTQVKIPSVTCFTVGAATASLQSKGFKVYQSPTQVGSPCAAGQVAGTNPSGSTAKGSTVTLLISNGQGGGNPNPGGPGPNPGPGQTPPRRH